jgi:hypothetical protein
VLELSSQLCEVHGSLPPDPQVRRSKINRRHGARPQWDQDSGDLQMTGAMGNDTDPNDQVPDGATGGWTVR